ncbi:hypothetical protein CKO25_00950 [Thiocapsa imhoffii]|uniref:Uncharacterized protein n=1 Tax=Thiocapsa imhoffii TaxID=382777 RepID=A0A9X0WES1_9GAMM|nr:DUF3226 domain-containing protein [Thiocapsa imhoffii]MBK1643243.1 hypothetical protein [Thiocapsa imhoffii]
MRKYGYLVVEGPHDVEFVYRLLSPFGLKRVRFESDLDDTLRPLIPREYPPGGDLQKRMPVPLFLISDSHAIAVHSAIGDTRLVETIEENLALLDRSTVTSIGLILDSDKQTAASERYARIRDRMGKIGLLLDEKPGALTLGAPRLGAFVLPDNAAAGTLEDLLLESAALVYPCLLDTARHHVDAEGKASCCLPEDLEDLAKPAGRNKAIIGAMASILRPGKAVQVSIQDNRWLRDQALSVPRIKAVQDFLRNLFDLP